MKEPNYILKFNDGVLIPKHESIAQDIIKLLLKICAVIFILLILVFGFEVIKEIPSLTWICLLSAAGYLVKQGGCERKPVPCELWFYDDYMVQYYERMYYDKRNIQKEYHKFYYADISKCLYRTVVHKIDIFGQLESEFYKYKKDGTVEKEPYRHYKGESISVFYTVLEPDIDFVKEIETHSPIKVTFEES